MSQEPTRFVYDAPRHLGGALLGEIRDKGLIYGAWTVDGRSLGDFVALPPAATAISAAMANVTLAPRPCRRRASS